MSALLQHPELPSRGNTVAPTCLGVCCERHAQCLRYHAVEFEPMTTVRIGTCGEKRGLFVPLKEVRHA
jgi:hypothetical protein